MSPFIFKLSKTSTKCKMCIKMSVSVQHHEWQEPGEHHHGGLLLLLYLGIRVTTKLCHFSKPSSQPSQAVIL